MTTKDPDQTNAHTTTPDTDDTAIAAAILALCTKRGPDKSICPSEAARRLSTDGESWRALMPHVRRVAGELSDRGQISVTQRGTPVDPRTAKGAIRLALKR